MKISDCDFFQRLRVSNWRSRLKESTALSSVMFLNGSERLLVVIAWEISSIISACVWESCRADQSVLDIQISPFRIILNVMYLRFRKFVSKGLHGDSSIFAEIYERVHGRQPAATRQVASDIRIQVSIVECKRVDGKPKQRHIAVLGSIRFGDAADIAQMRRKLSQLPIGKVERERLVAKIEEFFAFSDTTRLIEVI